MELHHHEMVVISPRFNFLTLHTGAEAVSSEFHKLKNETETYGKFIYSKAVTVYIIYVRVYI